MTLIAPPPRPEAVPPLPAELTAPPRPADGENGAHADDKAPAPGLPDPDAQAPAPGRPEAPTGEPHVLLQTHVNVRSASLVMLATLACLYVLHWASAIFIPLLLGLIFSYALTPLVDRMVRLHIPRGLAAALLLFSIVGGIGWMSYSLVDDAASMIESLPQVAQKLRRDLTGQRVQGPTATIDKVQRAAAELERAAEEGTGSAPAAGRAVTRVQIEPPRFNIKDYLWTGTLGLMTAAGQVAVVIFITLFLLASGDIFRRKMVKIAGPGFGQKKLTLQAMDEINLHIQRYLMVQVFTSAVVGAGTWLAFLWIGVEHAAVWGVAAFAFNFIPYFGSIVVTGGAALMGYVQFASFEMALLVGGATLFVNSIEAYILTPWLTGRASRMNPVAVFVGVLAWGWLWGIWGLFLGVPILMVIKAVCDRVDDLKSVGELLGA